MVETVQTSTKAIEKGIDVSPSPRIIVDRPKVLLVRPPQLFYFGVWPRGPRLSLPVGLLSIASFLKNKGVDATIYDCFVEGSSFDGDHVRRFKGDGNITKQWIRTFEDGGVTPTEISDRKGQLQHFGATWNQFRTDLLRLAPDIVGITNLFRENSEETLKAADLVREVLPNAVVAVGGPNATALPDFMLERSAAIDMIGLGDGELTLLDIVDWVRGKRALGDIEGIVHRGPDGHARTRPRSMVTELDEFGQLDYGLVRLERYFSYERNGIMARNKFSYDGAERSASLVTSRGCPYKCSFCSVHIHAGRKFRRYSVSHTLDHLETLVTKHGVRHIHFEDDNLTLDRERFMELMHGVLKRELKFTWDTPNGVFANTIDEEMLRLMKETGCVYLVVGVESGDQWVLDNVIHKQPLTLDRVLNAFRLAKKVGLDMQAFYIIGFPRETMKHIQKTLDFAMEGLRKYDVIPHMAIARADPGTDLYAEAKESGALVTDYSISNAGGVHIDMFVRHMVKTDEFSPENLEALNEDFHKRAIRAIGWKTLRYLLRHPAVALKSTAYLIGTLWRDRPSIRDAFVKLFFCNLFYKNALRRQRYFEST